MSRNKTTRPADPLIKPGADNIKSEAAKEFGIDGERKNVSSDKGIDKNTRMSVEAQMSGVPIYTKKKNEEKD
jgi:hypothetical protein